MTTVRILPVTTPKGRREIEAADRLCFPDDVPIAIHTAAWWIAKVDGTWAGYAGAKFYWIDDRPTVYLCRAGVLPEFRGQGLQRRMIRTRERWARKVKAEVILTDTVPDGVASMRSLIACGYRPYVPQARWREDGAIYWRRDLCQ